MPQSPDIRLVTESALEDALSGIVLNLRDQPGVVGDGVADDTTAINNAATSAASFGVKLFAKGVFKIAGTVTLACATDLSDATFNYTGTGTALQIGGTTPLVRKLLTLPKVIYTPKTGTGWTASTVGVKIVNAQTCRISFDHIQNFETGLWIYGDAAGNAWNTYLFGHLDNNKVNLLVSANATGFCNQNTVIGGRLSHNSNEGSQVADTRHITIANSTNLHNAWLFDGTSLETPDVVEYHIETWGQYCRFVGARFENTGGDSHRRIASRGTAKGNTIKGGFNSGQITQVKDAGALPFDIESDVQVAYRGGNSTTSTLLIENLSSSTAPAFTIMGAGAALAGDSPSTAYAVQATAQKWSGKRPTDSFNRLEMDYLNGRIYVGDATAAPVGYIGGSASTMFVGGSMPFCPLTTAAQDLGLTSLKWRDGWFSRYVRAATAVVTGVGNTASRPSASTAASGAVYYDTDLDMPIWSNGTTWRVRAVPIAYTPATNEWGNPSNVTGTAAGTPVNQTIYISPHDVGPSSLVIKGLGSNCTTNTTDGTYTITLGIYKDDGTGGKPDFTQQLGTVNIDATATGIRYTAFGSPITLPPGRYWTAFLYYATVAPSVAPQFTCVTAAFSLPISSSTAPGTINKTYSIASQTALPTTSQTLAANGGNNGAVVSIRIN